MTTIVRLLLAFALLTPYAAFAQSGDSGEKGILYSRYYSPKEYKANPQNWAALQRENGTMVFGNGDGIMTFDGSRWQLIRLTNNNLVRTVALGADHKLYAGGYNEFGYVAEDSIGRPRFISLKDKLKEELREPGHVWNILVNDDKVYFTTDKNILVLQNDKLTEIKIPSEGKFFSALFNDQIIIQPSEEGLVVLDGESLKSLPDGDFYQGKIITGILPYNKDVALICTMNHGFFLYDGKKNQPFRSEVTEFLKENRLYKAIRLKNGNFAMGTLNRGVIVMDPAGSLVHLIEKGRGLGDNAVYNLTEDQQGSLWVTMSVGISRVELQTPMTWFDERNGIIGAVNDITRYENNIYAATMLGFFKLETSPAFATPPRFQKVKEISSSVWAMTSRHGSLLLATDFGNVELKKGKYKILDDYSGAVVLGSDHDPDIVYVGLTDGVVVLQFANGEWRSRGRIEGLEADVGEMNEDDNGDLWLGTFSEGALHLHFPKQNGKRDYFHPQVSRFGEKEGLPVGYVQIHRFDRDLLFRVEPHPTVYRFNREKKFFEPYAFKGQLASTDSTTIFPFTNERDGKQWMLQRIKQNSFFDFVLLTSDHAGSRHEKIPFSRAREDVDEVLFLDRDGLAWLGGLDGIVRFEYGKYSGRNSGFNVILDEIRLKNDSILYSGTKVNSGDLTFPYDLNTIAFSFGATSYDLHEENEYQYILEGFDDQWSTWTKESSKSYTRIAEGTYLFKVRARNIYGDISPDATYAFTISPPWNRHILAYIAYALMLAGLVTAIVRVRSNQLVRRNETLEKIIQDRTTEISGKNFQLEQQAEELRTQTEQLKEMDKIKSNFFTNISHEFRTPLSLILAPLEKNLSGSPKDPEVEMMYRNARRLQNLINQLLDLSKLESGQMKVFLCKNDLTTFIRLLLASFQSLAETKDIRFLQSIPEKSIETYFDAEKIETIFYNLLSNAFKFTPEGGEISFTMDTRESDERVEFSVTDSGPGIPENEIPRIFDRFYQVDGGVQREFEGSGIGLALTKELVALLEGDIKVDSTFGKGTTFSVTLPFSTQEQESIPNEIAFDPIPGRDLPVVDAGILTDEIARGGEYTILLVEDNRDLSFYLSGILEKDYTVLVTFNGEDGLAVAKDVTPDLILSDMMMPKMDGFTLCEEIRRDEATSHIPFILLTARSSIESRLAGLELGADDYLTKPFHVAELQIRIKNLLQQRANLKKRFRLELKVAPKDVAVTSVDEKFLLKVIEVVQSNMSDSNFSVERLSEMVGMSRKNLHRKLVALVDQTPNEFIRIFRLKTAMQLLEQKAGSIKEAAFTVGFNNLSYFSKCFREQFGIAPTEVKADKKVAGQQDIV
jgi:signal transduction histidine kinase/DNA-binding response OmpR family regulator